MNPEEFKSLLEKMLEVFDKKYIEDLFEEGEKNGLFPPGLPVQGFAYPYKDYTYEFRRYRSW